MWLVKTQTIYANLAKIGDNQCKIHVSARFFVKIHILSPKSAHLEAAYPEALLFSVPKLILFVIQFFLIHVFVTGGHSRRVFL